MAGSKIGYGTTKAAKSGTRSGPKGSGSQRATKAVSTKTGAKRTQPAKGSKTMPRTGVKGK